MGLMITIVFFFKIHPPRVKWIQLQPSSLLLREVFNFHHCKEKFESNHSISQRLKCQKAENKICEWLFVSAAHSPLTHSECPYWYISTWYGIGCFFMLSPPHIKKKGDCLALIALECTKSTKTQVEPTKELLSSVIGFFSLQNIHCTLLLREW